MPQDTTNPKKASPNCPIVNASNYQFPCHPGKSFEFAQAARAKGCSVEDLSVIEVIEDQNDYYFNRLELMKVKTRFQPQRPGVDYSFVDIMRKMPDVPSVIQAR